VSHPEKQAQPNREDLQGEMSTDLCGAGRSSEGKPHGNATERKNWREGCLAGTAAVTTNTHLPALF